MNARAQAVRPANYHKLPRAEQDASYAENVVDLPPPFSDDALALRFCDRHGSDLRFVAAWGKWFRWDGARWRQDDTLFASDQARLVCREAAAECDGSDNAKATIASARTVAAVERLARADRQIAATSDQWDPDPWRLNTLAGVVDLRSGDLHPHSANPL